MGVAEMSPEQFQIVYNVLSFSLAMMMASTIFFWFRLSAVIEKYKSALLITGLVTFIAGYHYMRIFNSWNEAYTYNLSGAPQVTGIPFNDAYRYMDWLLTVPLLLIEIVLVMNLTPEEAFSKSLSLGSASALMIILGYPGELILDPTQLGKRWLFWSAAMVPFVYIVYTLLVGLSAATESEPDPTVRSLIKLAQKATVVSWLTYPVVYLFPMLGLSGSNAVVLIQLGYSASDIVAKCGVGFIVYKITVCKSSAERQAGGLNEATPLVYKTAH